MSLDVVQVMKVTAQNLKNQALEICYYHISLESPNVGLLEFKKILNMASSLCRPCPPDYHFH